MQFQRLRSLIKLWETFSSGNKGMNDISSLQFKNEKGPDPVSLRKYRGISLSKFVEICRMVNSSELNRGLNV